MERKDTPSSHNSNRTLLRYAGLGGQLLVAIGLSVFIGIKLDEWLGISPIGTIALPLLVLGVTFYKLIRETSKK